MSILNVFTVDVTIEYLKITITIIYYKINITPHQVWTHGDEQFHIYSFVPIEISHRMKIRNIFESLIVLKSTTDIDLSMTAIHNMLENSLSTQIL